MEDSQAESPTLFSQFRHLPVIASYPCTGANYVHVTMELYFGRPRLYIMSPITRTYFHPITLLKRVEPGPDLDYMWIQIHDQDTNRITVPCLYVYRNPIDTIFGLFNSLGWTHEDVHRVIPNTRTYCRFVQEHSASNQMLRIEDWIRDPVAGMERVAGFINPGVPFNLERATKVIEFMDDEELAPERVQQNGCAHMGGFSGSIHGPAGQRFKDMHEKTILSIVEEFGISHLFGV